MRSSQRKAIALISVYDVASFTFILVPAVVKGFILNSVIFVRQNGRCLTPIVLIALIIFQSIYQIAEKFGEKVSELVRQC
jgi:hypothetical protein